MRGIPVYPLKQKSSGASEANWGRLWGAGEKIPTTPNSKERRPPMSSSAAYCAHMQLALPLFRLQTVLIFTRLV